MSDRLCPLCDDVQPAATCPVHEVPTLAPQDGPRCRLEVGTVLSDRFRIDHLIGQGGMGALLGATELPSGRRVVVKVLRGERVTEPAHVRRFYQEARAVRALSHPNIVNVLMFGVDAKTRAPFLAMELVAGRTLKALIRQDGPLTEANAVAIFLPIVRALATAHRAHVLHRDLKPSNIMVDNIDGHFAVKVLDFGLAKILEDPGTVPLTEPGKTVGTPAFMSPEQITQGHQDFRTDLYGLGCVLHAALTGTPPFTGGSLIDVMRKQLHSPVPPLPPVLADNQPPSPGLRALHAQLLGKAPDDRPSSTETVLDALLALIADRGDEPNRGAVAVETHVDLHAPHLGASMQATPTPAAIIDPSMLNKQTTPEPSPNPSTLRIPLDDLSDAGPTARAAQLLPDTRIEGPLLPSGLFAPASDPSLTQVMPGSLDRHEGLTSDTPDAADTTKTESDLQPHPRVAPRDTVSSRSPRPAVAAARGPSSVIEPAVDPRLSVPLPATPSSPWWLAGISAAGIGLFLVVALTLTPARSDPVADAAPIQPVATPRASSTWISAFIEIRTRPAGAEVVVGSDWIGRTPVGVDRPAAGERQSLLIKRQGYRSQRVQIRHDTESPLEIELQAR